MAPVPPLTVDCAGDGPPVVMIHGLGGSSNTFQPLMARLSDHRVIRPDMPGAARSGLPTVPLSISGLAAAVLDLLRAMGFMRVHLVGPSMGTLVCQHLAAEVPDLVASLTLYGALTEPTEAARKGLGVRAGVARDKGMAWIADQIIAATLATRTHEHSPAAVAFVRESILRQNPEGYARNCEALARATTADPRRIKAPTLLITGDCDPVAPVSMAQVLADGIAGARLDVLDRCGHWVTVEQPAISSQKLAEHLQQHRN